MSLFTFTLDDATTISFDGFEADMEYQVENHITWLDPPGGIVGVPLFPSAANDEVTFRCTLWCRAAQSAQLEPLMPPFNNRIIRSLSMVGFADYPLFPGFGNYISGAWTYYNLTIDPIESIGQKNVKMDLFGYNLTGRFAACGYDASYSNEVGGVTPSSTTVPAQLARKFGSHQFQDPSTAHPPMPYVGAKYPVYTRHGRRVDAAVALDCLYPAELKTHVDFYRAVRNNTFSYPAMNNTAFGPVYSGAANTAYATKIECRHGRGYYYEATMSLTRVS